MAVVRHADNGRAAAEPKASRAQSSPAGLLHGGASSVQRKCAGALPGAGADHHVPGRPQPVHDGSIPRCSMPVRVQMQLQAASAAGNSEMTTPYSLSRRAHV